MVEQDTQVFYPPKVPQTGGFRDDGPGRFALGGPGPRTRVRCGR